MCAFPHIYVNHNFVRRLLYFLCIPWRTPSHIALCAHHMHIFRCNDICVDRPQSFSQSQRLTRPEHADDETAPASPRTAAGARAARAATQATETLLVKVCARTAARSSIRRSGIRCGGVRGGEVAAETETEVNGREAEACRETEGVRGGRE